MLLFIAILMAYLSICTVIVICHKLVRLPLVWRNTGMIIFFAIACHYFGLKTTTIIVLYVIVRASVFILQVLFPSVFLTTKSADLYKTIYATLLDGNDFYCGYKKQAYQQSPKLLEEQQDESIDFNKLVIYALVPLWLICFLSHKAFTNSFKFGSYLAFMVSTKRIADLKNIKAA